MHLNQKSMQLNSSRMILFLLRIIFHFQQKKYLFIGTHPVRIACNETTIIQWHCLWNAGKTKTVMLYKPSTQNGYWGPDLKGTAGPEHQRDIRP